MDKINGLISLLGEENVEELKKNLTRLIVEQAEEDLKDYGEYLLYPPSMRNIIKEAMESVDKKVSKMYKDAVIEINQNYIDKMKDYMTHRVNETELRTKIFDYAKSLKAGHISEELLRILKETEK